MTSALDVCVSEVARAPARWREKKRVAERVKMHLRVNKHRYAKRKRQAGAFLQPNSAAVLQAGTHL